jgi:hypothetical protein
MVAAVAFTVIAAAVAPVKNAGPPSTVCAVFGDRRLDVQERLELATRRSERLRPVHGRVADERVGGVAEVDFDRPVAEVGDRDAAVLGEPV